MRKPTQQATTTIHRAESGNIASPAITNRLDHLEELIEQMSKQLKSMESRLPAQPQPQH